MSRNMSKKSVAVGGSGKERKINQNAVSPSSGSLAANINEKDINTLAKQSLQPAPPQQSLHKNSDIVTVAKKSSSKMTTKPSLAAAMLSFPWPPPEHPKLVLARLREERKRLETDVETIKQHIEKDCEDGNENNTQQSGNTCCCCTKKPAKGKSSRKLYKTKKSVSSVDPRRSKSKQQHKIISGASTRKLGDPYLPVTIPPFKHVHTAWPEFDHAPVADWKNKYLVAKPWPYKQKRHDRVVRFPAESGLLTQPSAHMDLLNRNFTGRSLASFRSSPNVSSTDLINMKQRIQLERVGSCIK